MSEEPNATLSQDSTDTFGYEHPDGYTAGQAAQIMSKNSGRAVSPDLVKKLGQRGVIKRIPAQSNLNLYNKEDVKAYIVEERGTKAGRAAKERAKTKRATQSSAKGGAV